MKGSANLSQYKKTKINGHLIEEYTQSDEEYWWTVSKVVFINKIRSGLTYEKAVEWAWAQQPTDTKE